MAETKTKSTAVFAYLMPNPANLETILSYSVPEESLFKIMDLNGIILFNKQLNKGSSELKIPVSFLKNGFYIWNLQSINTNEKGKLIINR